MLRRLGHLWQLIYVALIKLPARWAAQLPRRRRQLLQIGLVVAESELVLHNSHLRPPEARGLGREGGRQAPNSRVLLGKLLEHLSRLLLRALKRRKLRARVREMVRADARQFWFGMIMPSPLISLI